MGAVNITYSIPYVVCMLAFLGLCFWEFRLLKNEQDVQIVRISTICLYLIFFGLRGFVLTDWYQYYAIFENLPTIWDGGLAGIKDDLVLEMYETDENLGVSGMEPLFMYLTIALKSIVPNYFVWVFINTAFDLLILDGFIRRYSSYYSFSILLFFVFGGLIIQINLMRNIKALLLFLVSIRFIEERRFIPFLLLNLLGLGFHTTALFFFPLYFVLHREISVRWMWIILIIGLSLVLFQVQYIKPILLKLADMIGGRLSVQIKIYFALDFYSQAYGLSLGFLERAFTYVVIIINYDKLIKQNRSNVIFINVFTIYFIVNSFFTEMFIIVDRVSMLFIFAYWILYAELILLVKDKVLKWFWFSLVIFYGALKLIVMNSNIFSKYDNLLFGIESYEERSQTRYHEIDNFRQVE
ncbi:MAG: EpsG family protein [Bacteroidales bacterium]|nr:EpsG family protein [Bacteroidales bacterium]